MSDPAPPLTAADHVANLVDDDSFKPAFTNRRRMAIAVLSFCAIIWSVIVAVTLYLALDAYLYPQIEGHIALDPTISTVLTTALWASGFLGGGIATSYIFGANNDVNKYRDSVITLVKSLRG